jgi:membrane-bound lytic murein transglycosylase B
MTARCGRPSFLPEVVQRDRNQTEFTKTIWDYLDLAVSRKTLALGRQGAGATCRVLDRIEANMAWKEVVAAIWGLESAYGTVRGDIDTISALATLAYDGRRGGASSRAN